jgi:hypothetical protein
VLIVVNPPHLPGIIFLSRRFTHNLHCQCAQDGGILYSEGVPTGEMSAQIGSWQ